MFLKIHIKFAIILLIFSCFILSVNTVAKENTPKTINELKNLMPDSTIIENKVVYVDFWASWCVPCRKSFPWMKELLQKYSDSGLVIITINVDKNHDAAKNFLKENNLQSINIFDPSGKIAESFSLAVMPTSFIYNKSGEFVFKHTGFSQKESKEVEQTLVTLLHESKVKHE